MKTTTKLNNDLKQTHISAEAFDKMCMLSSYGIFLALSNYYATENFNQHAIKIEISGQHELPPQFMMMCRGIIARYLRALLDGNLEPT